MDSNLLNEIEKLNGTLDRFEKMNNGEKQKTSTILEKNDVTLNKENNSSMFDGIIFDIFLSILIIAIRSFLSVKYDEPFIKKVGIILALLLPYIL